ncbi:hypothetical protein BKK50_10715 [Rodentibacter rarus]|uniref:Plasmid replication protein RepL domain-containing protein n=1 Tax=Rodentibacter rarus TaxID=1908260 RepID=A0A1V3IFA8_9PAST|nr:replication/maintenance protein RepL [Rodentibacter rarus]OOF39381.1 hypothetical protein BKK50_10715 [Rodentibacter rarus]
MEKVERQKDSLGNVHYVGKKKLVDLSTGEEFEAQTIVKAVGDQDFKKVFLSEVLDRLEEFSSAKMKFVFWLMANIDKQNRMIGTYTQLAEKSGISVSTIKRVIPTLKKADVIREITPSVIMLNPDIVAAVTSSRRGNLLVQYKTLDGTEQPVEPTAEEAE